MLAVICHFCEMCKTRHHTNLPTLFKHTQKRSHIIQVIIIHKRIFSGRRFMTNDFCEPCSENVNMKNKSLAKITENNTKR